MDILGNPVQAFCFGVKGWQWREEVLGEERKCRWLPELLQKGKGVCSWKLGLEMPGRVGVYFAGRDRQFHMRVVEKEKLA